MATRLYRFPGSETKASMLASAKAALELAEINRQLTSLLQDTPYEVAQWHQIAASKQWEQLDPNKDKERWNQARKELNIAQFAGESLMVEAGAAEIIQPGAGKLTFGPWRESVVVHPALDTNCCISFDAGKVLAPPAEILAAMTVTNRPGNDFFEAMPESHFWAKYRAASKATNALARWIEASNVDAVALGTYGVVVFCPVRSSMNIDDTGNAADWEKYITPSWLLWKLYFTEKELAGLKPANTYEVLTIPTETSASTNDLCYFRTRSGALGLLQITGFTENPRGVKIRYKLAQKQIQNTINSSTNPPTTYSFQNGRIVHTNNNYKITAGRWVQNLGNGKWIIMDGTNVFITESTPIEMFAGPRSDDSGDLRAARAKLAELREKYSDQHPVVLRALARIKELERMTKEEPNASSDLREAKAHLAELLMDDVESRSGAVMFRQA
jgi:hypothetical protein